MSDHAIVVAETGDASRLRFAEVTVPAPLPREVVVKHRAIGVNFIDVYHRTGLYKVPQLPYVPGSEAAGVVEAVGAEVTELEVGARVAYGTGPLGAYSERRTISADLVVPIPEQVSFEQAAAIMLKGMTAEYLAERIAPLAAGDVVLVHAAAGGTGSLLCQWLADKGVIVVGVVSTEAKAAFARARGCAHVVVQRQEDFVARARAITNGRGVRAVYDSVGRDTFARSLDCLMPRGIMVSFGQSSGPVPPLEVGLLAQKGSLFLTRPTLFTYTATRAELLASATALFERVARGALTVTVGQTIPLAEAARAHEALEARQTVGATILVP